MSEHMSIKGDIDFIHLPMEEEGSFSYCHHCKKPVTRLTIFLHQGICNDWIQVRCPKCKKTIWIAELTSNEEEHPKSYGHKLIVKEKYKCRICGKETNTWDCMSYSYDKANRVRCICSMKCEKIRERRRDKKDAAKTNTKH